MTSQALSCALQLITLSWSLTFEHWRTGTAFSPTCMSRNVGGSRPTLSSAACTPSEPILSSSSSNTRSARHTVRIATVPACPSQEHLSKRRTCKPVITVEQRGFRSTDSNPDSLMEKRKRRQRHNHTGTQPRQKLYVSAGEDVVLPCAGGARARHRRLASPCRSLRNPTAPRGVSRTA